MIVNCNIPLPIELSIVPDQDRATSSEAIRQLPSLPLCVPFGAMMIVEELPEDHPAAP